MVDSLADEFRMLSSRYLNSVYEPEPIPSGSESDCSTASDESNHQKHKVPDAKKRGGLMKLAQAFSGSGNRSNPKSASAAARKVKLKTEDVWDTPSPDSSETEIKNRKAIKSKVSLLLYCIWFVFYAELINIYFDIYRTRLTKRKVRAKNHLQGLEILMH